MIILFLYMLWGLSILVITYKSRRKRSLEQGQLHAMHHGEKSTSKGQHNMNITSGHYIVKLCNNQCCIQMLTNTLICGLHQLIYILFIAQHLS